MIIFLVGMPGCGKSTVGKALALRLGYAFLDLDTLIEQREGQTVPQIFEQRGQEYFRGAEAAALRSVSGVNGGVVLATGGGAPCFHNNMGYMVQHGLAVYLKVRPQELVARLTAHDLQIRPLLRDKSPAELRQYLAQTLGQREAFYAQAPVQLEVGRLTVERAVTEITNRIRPLA